jgi:hypothetical protein
MDGSRLLCPPTRIFMVFMAAHVLFSMYLGAGKAVIRDIAYAIIGVIFFTILCAAGMDYVAWGLLCLPIFFYILLLAILIFDQSFLQISSRHSPSRGIQEDVSCNCSEETGCDDMCT